MRTSYWKTVGFLTPDRFRRRESDDVRRVSAGIRWPWACTTTVLVLASCWTVQAYAVDGARHSTAAIATAAVEYLQARTGVGDPRVILKAGQLDPRLNLPRCSRPLEGFLRGGTEIRTRTIVGVRCGGDAPWKVYVPVDVIVMDSVLVTARTLPGGQVPGPDDVRIETRDVSRLASGYLSSADELAGQRLKSQVHAGRVITPAMLQADMVIRRGQTVTLLVSDARVNIRMSGKALTDGAVNQRIRVENAVSKRVVEGLVRSPEHVEILVN